GLTGQPKTQNSVRAVSVLFGRRLASVHQSKGRFYSSSVNSPSKMVADDLKENVPLQKEAKDIAWQTDLSHGPEFNVQKRIRHVGQLAYKADIAQKDPTPIKITLPDGKQFDAEACAEKISKGLAENTVIAKVNGEVWDLDRPFEGDATLQLLKFDDDEAKQVFWHSSAHVLGEAMERYCGGHLCYGPPIEEGFYYDMWHDNLTISKEDFPNIDQIVKCAIKDKQPFERLEMTKEDLLEMFKYNEFKVRIIKEKIQYPENNCIPLWSPDRSLPWPACATHRKNQVQIILSLKAMQITKASASYWEGKADAESLQRVYGISFPDPKQLKEWQKFQEEAAKRDHRKLGRDQELFFFNPLSPGSAFWYPKGAHIYNTLVNFIRKEYRKRGFTEVITPNMYNSKLWETSGHWQHYADDMFR
ncbi:TGS domain protein, partial [Cooperia oncophora]